jgi:hypothetical protein
MSLDAAAKKLAELNLDDKSKGTGDNELDAKGKTVWAQLWETVSKDRLLPSTYRPCLDILQKENDATLIQAVRMFITTEDLGELRDAVDGAVVDRLARRWDAMFVDCSTSVAKTISQNEKKDKNLTGLSSLVYGEVLFSSLARVICKYVPLRVGMNFYDVGSGSGRGVMLATILHEFKRCQGIEILSGLYGAAMGVRQRYIAEFAPRKDGVAAGAKVDVKSVGWPPELAGPEVHFHNSDFRLIDWSDADLVFANSTCFDEQLMTDLARQAERMRAGAIIMTLTKGLQSTHFQVLESKQYPMSWGMATCITQRKILPPA